jgi:hypothetical protein
VKYKKGKLKQEGGGREGGHVLKTSANKIFRRIFRQQGGEENDSA